jgi:anti-sigma factor RsiW
MKDPQDRADLLETISRYVDGDLFEEERRAFEAALDGNPSLHEDVRATQAVKAALSRVTYHNAPPELVIRVREELERAEARSRRPERFVWGVRWLRPALGLAAAMVVMFVFNLGDSPQRVALAEEVTDQCCAGHWRCCKPENRARHQQTSDPKELEPYLTTELKGVEITVPDLSQRGLTLIEGHVCSVLEIPTAHVYYEAPGVCLSYYVIHGDIEEGVLGKRIPGPLDAYALPEEYWKGRTDENLRGILWWCPKNCLCLVIADLTESELTELVRQCFPVRQTAE